MVFFKREILITERLSMKREVRSKPKKDLMNIVRTILIINRVLYYLVFAEEK